MSLHLEAVPPMVPCVHMNGTSKQDLLKQQIAVIDAANALLAALRAATPNGRDFYPLGDEALVRAAGEHRNRLASVAMVHDDAETIALAIQAQGRGR
jgi:hypothetical protein